MNIGYNIYSTTKLVAEEDEENSAVSYGLINMDLAILLVTLIIPIVQGRAIGFDWSDYIKSKEQNYL